jgi:hypothetical protein
MMDREVRFDEVERSWNPAATGSGAQACFDELVSGLAARGVLVDATDVAELGAMMWATLDNTGKPPGAEGRSRTEELQRLADALGRHWLLVSRTTLDGAEMMRAAGVDGNPPGCGIPSLGVLLAWRLMWWQWSEQRGLPAMTIETEQASLDRDFLTLLRSWTTRPPAWAGGQTGTSAWPLEQLQLLAEDWSALKRAADVADAVRILVSRSRTFLAAPAAAGEAAPGAGTT